MGKTTSIHASILGRIGSGRLGSGATVVTLMCDTGVKYLGTDQYRGG